VVARRDLQAIVRIDRLFVCGTTTLRYPGTVARAKHRFNGGHKTARRDCNRDRAVVPVVNIRFTIGDNKETVAL
jgi:hypothetical protein